MRQNLLCNFYNLFLLFVTVIYSVFIFLDSHTRHFVIIRTQFFWGMLYKEMCIPALKWFVSGISHINNSTALFVTTRTHKTTTTLGIMLVYQ
jgi:cell shape-determining protein MreC